MWNKTIDLLWPLIYLNYDHWFILRWFNSKRLHSDHLLEYAVTWPTATASRTWQAQQELFHLGAESFTEYVENVNEGHAFQTKPTKQDTKQNTQARHPGLEKSVFLYTILFIFLKYSGGPLMRSVNLAFDILSEALWDDFVAKIWWKPPVGFQWNMTGWWFGSWILWLSIYIGNNHPNWLSLHHFSEG